MDNLKHLSVWEVGLFADLAGENPVYEAAVKDLASLINRKNVIRLNALHRKFFSRVEEKPLLLSFLKDLEFLGFGVLEDEDAADKTKFVVDERFDTVLDSRKAINILKKNRGGARKH